MTAPDTARREWASKWFQEDPTMTRYQAYLAGAREEAAIKDAEIATLKHNLEVVRENHRSLELHCANREALLQSLIALRNEQTTEIAALREQLDTMMQQAMSYGGKYAAATLEIAALREFVRWHFTHHPQSWPGFSEIMPAVRRALEGQP